MEDIEARSFFILNENEMQNLAKQRQQGHEQRLIEKKMSTF